MEFKDFQYLTHGDPVTFLLAWNMLLENGRVSLREHDVSDLAAGLQVRMSNFMTEEKTRSVAETAKGLAELEPSLILHFLQRASHIITLPGEPQEGQCPVCGGGLKYQTPVVDGHEVRRRYRCEDCAATGEEVLTGPVWAIRMFTPPTASPFRPPAAKHDLLEAQQRGQI